MAICTETITLTEPDNFSVGDVVRFTAPRSQAFIDNKTAEIDTLYAELMDQLNRSIFAFEPTGTVTVTSIGPEHSPTSTAALAVVTTVAALEWLRRRKVQVAAAENDAAARSALVTEFVAWLRVWLERLGMVRCGAQGTDR